jgi:hypothetical protein
MRVHLESVAPLDLRRNRLSAGMAAGMAVRASNEAKNSMNVGTEPSVGFTNELESS